MYVVNFEQQSNCETWLHDWQLIAEDDGSPIQNEECIVYLQVWARTARGGGDQSNYNGWWPAGQDSFSPSIPQITANTRDGTGRLILYDGTLEMNIPDHWMMRLLPGYYEVGMVIATPDNLIKSQLCVGLVPIYNGEVWQCPN